jgi:long-subunit fatty acid transport protein
VVLCAWMSVPRMPRRPAFAVVLALALQAGLPLPSPASPLEDTTVGGAVFTGPAHPHATAIYINPAALGLGSQGWYLYLGGSMRLDQYDIQRQRITDPSSGLEPAPPVSDTTFTPAGALGFYTVGSTATAGLATSLPLSHDFIGDQTDLGYHTLGGHYRQVAWLSLAASFRANQRLSAGMSVSLTQTWMNLSFLRDTALELGTPGITSDCGGGPCGVENPAAAERYDVTVKSRGLSTQNLALNAGVVYQVAQDWWVGVAYQTPPGLQAPLTLTGTVAVTPSPRDQAAGAEGFTAEAEVIYRLPQAIALGVRGPILPRYELVAGARWENLSPLRQLDIRIFGRDATPGTPEWYPRYLGLRDVITLEAGLETRADQPLRLGTRLRFESGATSSTTISPMFVQGMNLTLVLGNELRLLDGLVVSASYGFTWFPRVQSQDSQFSPLDHLACVDSQYDIDACAASAEGRAIPSAAGSYGHLRHAARVSIRYSFL